MALRPSNATVSIDGNKFNAMSAHVGIETEHDNMGMPLMGTIRPFISCVIDIHDTTNLPFQTLKTLFEMANGVTRDKIKDMKVEFWADESHQDAICTYTFRGWISAFHTTGGGEGNHTLDIKLQPELDAKQFIKLEIGN